MTEASVGFQCPECIAEGRATVRQPTGRFGGAVASGAPVTLTMVGLCVLVFVGQWLTGLNDSLANYGLWPLGVAVNGDWWRLGTAMFLHVSILHILFNMYVLWILGPQLERLFGHVRFLGLYLVAGLGGSAASYYFSDPNVVSAGASGAIFGLMGALVVTGWRVRAELTQVLVLIGINLVIGFVAGGVDWRAHLGGLFTGALVAAVYTYAPRSGRSYYQVVGCLGAVVILLAVTMVRTQQLQDLYRQLFPGG
jgi:membrane associated rhomboid family serine protease